ncbi:MAG TPA: flagellar biosynthesis protein FliQ [Burkholderiaceae bacterium]|nr:flagellar biosynthesis protein FliQ [Burkholderiaceae bacterium]
MRSDLALQLMGELLWNAVLIAAPMLGLTLLVGMGVSILQAVTQVQEMSLSFVPKLLMAVATLVLFGPWMLRKLTTFASTLISNIPAYF